jgi:hypothetical protein
MSNITLGGKLYSCRFEVEGGMVTVHSSYGTKTTQQGGLPAIKVAELLFSELVRESADS